MVRKRLYYHYYVRKLKRKAELIQAQKLFEASLESDLNLLKEMKAIKGGNPAKLNFQIQWQMLMVRKRL